MKKLILVLGLVVASLCVVTAQDVNVSTSDYKIKGKVTRLEIFLGKVTVEATNGNEVVISSQNERGEKDDRAKGLHIINGSGLEDNTGQGVNVTAKENGVYQIKQLSIMTSPEVKIFVPKGVIVYYEFESQHGEDVKFKNLDNEIEISANYNDIKLENITGPVTAKCVYCSIEADFNVNVKGPISIISVYDYVDVTLPVATKADLKMNTSYGALYAAQEFKIEYDKQQDGNMVRYDNKVSGKINGGGVKIELTSNYEKVYLRKK